jgi:Tfp pilus assembly protein PilV
MKPRRTAFTLIEVLLSMLLLGLGLLSVIAMTLWGTREATKAMAMATAYGTARSALYDPKVIDASASAADPSVTGYLNGYFVVRTIEASSFLPASGGTIDQVRVNVYWGNDGESLAGVTSYVRR